MQIPASTERVPRNTSEEVNRRIRRIGEVWVSHCAAHPEDIEPRLQELGREWDIERALEANAAGLCVLGVAMGVLSGKKWFAVPGIVGAFLLQHAVEGWCPPLPVLRRLGFRTRAEIDEEKFALKALRGGPRSGEREREPGHEAVGGSADGDHRLRGGQDGRGQHGKHARKPQGGPGKRESEGEKSS